MLHVFQGLCSNSETIAIIARGVERTTEEREKHDRNERNATDTRETQQREERTATDTSEK